MFVKEEREKKRECVREKERFEREREIEKEKERKRELNHLSIFGFYQRCACCILGLERELPEPCREYKVEGMRR